MVPSIFATASLTTTPLHFLAPATLNFQLLAQTLALLGPVLSPSHTTASIYKMPATGQTWLKHFIGTQSPYADSVAG